ncbi:vWA domain-containing protein [Flavobacterium microcysteis]
MQFKHPEILYFLFLLVIPILVHLFQLRRFKKEYFTNVHFLKELAIQTRKSSRLKKWLLLLTRLFLLACLIIAFAQPFFQAKDSKGITNEMFIVLDNSFSMQAKGKQGELMKRAVQELLENAPENQTFSLITNSEIFWNTDIKSIQRELQNLKYSASPFVLDNLMAKIKSRKSPYNKDIVIITDAVRLQPKQLKSIDSTSNTYFIIPKAEQKNNVAIDSVFIQQALDNFYEIGIRLSSYGDNEKDIPISLYNNKKLIAKTIVNFDGKEKSINFTIPKEDFNGYALIEDNALQYDNQLFFSISKPQKMNIVSIGQPEKSGFLKKIYSDNEFIYTNFDLKSLDYNILEKQDAILLNEIPEIPQALQTTLKAFVEKGGNLVVIPSSESSISNLNSLMGNFGKIQFQSLENGEKLVTKIAFSHPLYSTVFEKKIENFQYPNVSSSYSISSVYPAILSFEDQNAFLTAVQNPVSSVYVFSAPINKTNSNFQNSPLIVPTFYNMALSSQKTGISALTIGENSPFLIDASLSKDEILEIKSLSGDTDEKFIPMQQILNNKVKLTFNDFPQEAGNFGIYKQDNLLKEISFNYARTESNIDASNESILSDYNVIGSIDEVFDTLQTDRTDNEIWKWFVFLTLLFLVTEILIQKFVK